MNINVAKSAGFCSGVKRALNIARKAARTSGIEMLGDIVHNEEVVEDIKKCGIKKIKTLSKNGKKTLLIRAHGTSLRVYKKAKRLGYKIIDATCPMVKEIHKIAKRMENKGYKIIIIGDRLHDEVKGIIGQLKKKALVIENKKVLPVDKLRRIKKAAVVVQSTQNLEKTLKTAEALNELIGDLKFFNTICNPTRQKQKEIQVLPKLNDLVIVIGSRASANTKRLYQISRSLNKNTYWIQNEKQLQIAWFKKARNVGITAGASTPKETIDRVVKKIRQMR